LWENLAFSYIIANTPLAFLSSFDTFLQSSDLIVSIPASETSVFSSEQSNIVIIGIVIFIYTSKLLGSNKFQLYLCSSDIQANSAQLAEVSNLFNIPSEYHEFTNILSTIKAKVLTSHCSYDFQINLKEDTQLLISPIYSLLASKQEALRKFIEENLNISFI